MTTLSPGVLVDNKYQVERMLGEGGMGVVWLARDVNTEVPVVLKAIRAEYAYRKDFRDRILAEGRALARIDHPNVVRLNAVVVDGESLLLVMQYVEGETLEARIARHVKDGKPLSTAEVLRIFRQILLGVAAAHEEGIIHRDLKPANVLIRAKDGVVKVTDFGIAKAEEDGQKGRGNTQGTIGSALYMAPEQCTAQSLDKRADVYALGVVLFELLTGRVPFDGPSNFEIMKKHVEEPLPELARLRPDVPAWLERIARRCCEKDPNGRFGSCEEIAAALDAGPSPGPFDAGRTEPMPPLHVQHTHARSGTAPGSAITASPRREGPRKAAAIAITIALAAALGLGITYGLGWIGPVAAKKPQIREPQGGPPKDEPPPPPSLLPSLTGPWESDSGRLYDAVMQGEVLEMRIRDAKPLAAQGYVDGEPRFHLRPVPGKRNVFSVEDRLRPLPPAGTTLDPERARATCLVPYSSVGGKPLEARMEGGFLRVQMVRIEPEAAMLDQQGKRVVGCKNLATARTTAIESTFTRP
ncbi:serine/threonine-protein kinase [Polyangium aurulentum]|uniref:serine/threonine-protein kinase n=1 Tax=Polyangium aurulentum TaxID=2567896 RepID=UPI00200CDA52|nr:serine/threonine-protein kinase [Polyangium aurulentum]UQA61759.1 serine/threonine protein kinase [Polyangium aurulentum]